MARNAKLLAKRNAALYKEYKALADKNKLERKYRMEYLIKQVADKFYVTENTVYHAIRSYEAPPPEPPSLFDAPAT
jgi:hypothetical protein